MGYCVYQQESKFHLPASRLPMALAALNTLALRAGRQPGRGFPFADTATLLRAQSVEQHMKEWRWRLSFDAHGDIVDVTFEGEKLGADHALWSALAPFVSAGSFIVMHGEDGNVWRWVFDGAKCLEQDACIGFAPVKSDIIDMEPVPPKLAAPR